MICIICNQNILSTKGISRHLRSIHGITTRQYYDKYLKKPNEGICPLCGKPTKYYNFTKGYNGHCSVRCSTLDPKVVQKLKNTNIKRYGVESGFQTDKCLQNIHSIEANDKRRQTIKQKFGSFRNMIVTPEICNKRLQTNLKLYGVTSPLFIPKIRTITLKAAQSDSAKLKRYTTRKANGWNRYISEKEFISKLEELNIEYEYNYKSELYPWKVDFYLPKKKLYIELNLNWSHGQHWFNKSNKEDNKKLKIWKNKNSDYYNNAIKTWTEKDIQKRDWSIEHNLNYVVVWNKDQITKLISDLSHKKCFKGFIDYNEV